MNAQYLIDRWERYQRVIQSQNRQKIDFSFQGKTIFELGCGPVFGWGPIAIFRGAKKYYYHDPALITSVVKSDDIKNKYFVPLHKELISNFGDTLTFNDFYERVMNQCIPIDLSKEESIDLILSNSVLEHVPSKELGTLLSKLQSILKSGGYFFHSVDHGSHGIGGYGFGSLYSKNRSNELKDLNLLRKSEINNLFIEAGVEAPQTVIYHSQNINNNSLHPSWKSYSNDDLCARVVFYFGKKH